MALLLLKRFLRSFRHDFIRFAARILLVAVVVAVIVSLESAAFTIIEGRSRNADAECLEDGQFTVLFPLSEQDLDELAAAHDVELQENFAVDVEDGDACYRFFRQREKIDALVLDSGVTPSGDSELVIEQNYAAYRGIACGDTLKLRGKSYTVVGTGSLPDYVHSVRHASDASAAPDNFTWVIASDSEFEAYLSDAAFSKEYTYSYIAGDRCDIVAFYNALKEREIDPAALLTADEGTRAYLASVKSGGVEASVSNLLSFTEREDNRRMNIELDFAYLYRTASFIVGAMLVAMLAFIFAVVTRNEVRNDHTMIGSLYALGVSKSAIMMSYLLPSVILTFIGGLIGLVIGYLPFITAVSMNAFHNVNSFPYYALAHPQVLYLYALAMPPVVSAVVDFFVLNRSLSHPALSLIRGTYEEKKNLNIHLGDKHFIRCFQFHRVLEERGSLIVFVSVLVSLTMLMLGLSTDSMIRNNAAAIRENVAYSYLCTVRFAPSELETDGEKLYVEEVKSACHGKNVSFSLIGVSPDSRYYAAKPSADRASAVAGRALASKFNLEVGDRFSFRKGIAEDAYTVEITDIAASGSGLELYMDISAMYGLLDTAEGYYNVVAFSDEPDIDDSLLYATVKTDDILENIGTLRESVTPFMWLCGVSSVMIFVITMFLIVSTMIDRAASGMALLRVMGFRLWEIQRMYVNPIIYAVVLALFFAIPLAKLASDFICPYVYVNMAIGMFFDLPMRTCLTVFAGVLVLSLLILLVLMKKVRRADTSVVLKCRE